MSSNYKVDYLIFQSPTAQTPQIFFVSMQQQPIPSVNTIPIQQPLTSHINAHPQNVAQVLQTLQSSMYILYQHYEPSLHQYQGYIKLTLLLILVYAFYKLGRRSVTDSVLKQKEQLKTLIEKRNSVKDELPKRIQELNKSSKVTIVVIVLMVAVLAYGFFAGYQVKLRQLQAPIVVCLSVVMLVLVYFNVEKFILNRRLKKVGKYDLAIYNNLTQFTQALGPKVISILKYHLCKSLHAKFYASKTVNQCQKINCKQYRSHLKTRNDSIAVLAQQTLDFQWCSICKKRPVFDEYLAFEARQFKEVQGASQEEQVRNKLGYLLEGLERMRKWMGETSPCNCSKLYWKTLTSQIMEYKKQDKATEAALNQLRSKERQL